MIDAKEYISQQNPKCGSPLPVDVLAWSWDTLAITKHRGE